MKHIEGGVCAAVGFKAGGVHAGVKKNPNKNDLAIILSDVLCNVSATYTTNKVKAAPLYVTMSHLENKKAKAIIANSGNANACAPKGEENAIKMCKAVANTFGVCENDVVVASTGVIGEQLKVEVIENAMDSLKASLSADGSDAAGKAIMTTDTFKKEIAVETEIGGKTVK
ncbi:MAG: bifunctional ornithine acetyltransferase/N-acetylglutamate synthase, partial [Oscillospiraceae bacterium]